MSEFKFSEDSSRVRVRSMRPQTKTWVKHSLLLGLTFVTSTIAATIQPFGRLPVLPELDSLSDAPVMEILAAVPAAYLNLVKTAVLTLITNAEALQFGLSFSLSLLFILTAHEAGHYIACRIYRVNATLPYFLPTPPLIGPAGTLGAFIRIISPIPSRRAIFDIGVAGPIAGFAALIPVTVLAVLTLENAPAAVIPANGFEIVFSDPLTIRLLAGLGSVDLSQPILPNPFYYASWIGLLVTALNLIPSGQLDGGHAIYAVFGRRIHYWTGRTAFAAMSVLSVMGLYFYGSPSGFLFAVILAVMMLVKHPDPLDSSPLGAKRNLVAFLTLIIFLLSFVPFPIQLS